MTGRDLLRQDIIEKATGFLINETKVAIRTIPSTKYPKGAKYEGFVLDVKDSKIILNDTFVMKRFEIFISEIASPADIWAKEEET